MMEETTQEFSVDQIQLGGQQSVVNQKLSFHESHWVVSVLNTKEKEFGGHAVILVEGSRSFKRPVMDVEQMIQSIKKDKVKTENAHLREDNYIRYQYLGSDKAYGLLKLFSQSGRGINCAEWCLEKLKVAGIDLEVKPTPTQVAGGICSIL